MNSTIDKNDSSERTMIGFDIKQPVDLNGGMFEKHFGNLSVYAIKDDYSEFLHCFGSLKQCFEWQFHYEEKTELRDPTKLNYYHKLIHKIFLISMSRFERRIPESKEARLEIYEKIRSWYNEHKTDFKSNLREG